MAKRAKVIEFVRVKLGVRVRFLAITVLKFVLTLMRFWSVEIDLILKFNIGIKGAQYKAFPTICMLFPHAVLANILSRFACRETNIEFKVARNSFLARAAWVADCACSRERTRLTQVQI